MRIRAVASCAAITCAGAVTAGAVSCVSSNNPGAPGTDASFSEDTGQLPSPEAGSDATPTPIADAGPDTAPDPGPDAATTPDAAPQCAPQSIAGFVVPPYLPAAQLSFPNGCFAGESAALGIDCYSDASTPQSCAGFPEAGDDGGPVSALCLGCLFTPEGSDAGYGPVIESVVPIVNLAGCIQETDETDAGYQCAGAIQAAWECTEYACKTNCPVTDSTSRAAYVTCTSTAATGVCSAYTTAAQTCIAAEEADSGSPTEVQLNCFDGTTPLLEYFCGS